MKVKESMIMVEFYLKELLLKKIHVQHVHRKKSTCRNECKDTVFDIDFYRKKIILQKPRENEHERGGRCGTLGK